MTAQRYWRASLIDSYGNAGLELTAFWLLSGTERVDAPAVLTASRPPDAGALDALQGPGPASGNAARWNNCAGLMLTWDFGEQPSDWPDVTDIRLGAGAGIHQFPCFVQIDYSGDASAWETYAQFSGITWPGAHSLTRSVPREMQAPVVYANNWEDASAASGLTLFSGDGAGKASSAAGTLTLTSGSDSFVNARLDGCPPLVDFEAQVRLGSGQRPGLVFHTNGWGSHDSNVAWFVYVMWSQVYVNKGTDSDAGSVTQPIYWNANPSVLRLRVQSGILSVFNDAALLGTFALTEFTGAGGFALRAAGGSANFGELTIRDLRPKGVSYIEVAPGGAIARALPSLARVHSRAGLPTPMTARAVPSVARTRLDYRLNSLHSLAAASQSGHVAGVVQHKDVPANTPVHRRVRLYRSRDGLLVQAQWSDPVTGAYDFQFVETDQLYTVIAEDYAGHWRAVVADRIAPEPMTQQPASQARS